MMGVSTIPKGSVVVAAEQDDAAAAVQDETRAIIKQMLKMEKTTYNKKSLELIHPFNGLWRQQIIQWMFGVVNYCHLSSEAVAAASYYLDSCVSKGIVQTPDDYQLVAMSALYLALKVFDSPTQRVIKLSSLVKLGTGRFNEQDVLQMEQEILRALEWRLHPPTALCFFHIYMRLLENKVSEQAFAAVQDESKAILEVLVCRECFLKADPSVLGFAAILAAIEGASNIDMTLTQLNAFLFQMTHVAQLDSACPELFQVSQDLADVMSSDSCTDPTEEEEEGSRTSTSTTATKNSAITKQKSASSKNTRAQGSSSRKSPASTSSRSPNHVIWRYL